MYRFALKLSLSSSQFGSKLFILSRYDVALSASIRFIDAWLYIQNVIRQIQQYYSSKMLIIRTLQY